MKRTILTGALVVAAGFSCLGFGLSRLMAQQAQPAAPAKQGQAEKGQPKGPAPKSPAEGQAVAALFNAANTPGNPDAIIKAAEDLTTKFADTDFKEIALMVEAQAYQQKGDADKAQIYGERVLEVNPKNFQTTLMLGEILATHTRENDLDKEEKLSKADKYLNGTIDNLKTVAKPNPQVTDQQWEDAKKQLVAEAHNALGLVALDRKKYDVAIAEFKLAIEGDPQATYSVRLASAYQSAGKNQEAIEICDKLLADPQLHPQIKAVATQVKAAASKK
jgi:tetratricopeptide (TPR) repeat protein